MNSGQTKQSRKKFISLGVSAAAFFTAFRFFIPAKKKKTQTVKMLTPQGQLVEVEVARLPAGKRKKITDEQLKKWVSKKENSHS